MLTFRDLTDIGRRINARIRRNRIERKARAELAALRDGLECGDESLIAECMADVIPIVQADPCYGPELRAAARAKAGRN